LRALKRTQSTQNVYYHFQPPAAAENERKSVARHAAARRATLFLSFWVGWGTDSTTFEKP